MFVVEAGNDQGDAVEHAARVILGGPTEKVGGERGSIWKELKRIKKTSGNREIYRWMDDPVVEWCGLGRDMERVRGEGWGGGGGSEGWGVG